MDEAPTPRRLGGWLILAMVVLFAWPLKLASTAVLTWVEVQEAGVPYAEFDPQWLFLTGWDLLTAGCLAALSLWTLPQFWRKRKVARTLMLAFFVANFTVGVGNAVLAAVFSPVGSPPASVAPFLLMLLINGAWITYFSKSKRVLETFIRS